MRREQQTLTPPTDWTTAIACADGRLMKYVAVVGRAGRAFAQRTGSGSHSHRVLICWTKMPDGRVLSDSGFTSCGLRGLTVFPELPLDSITCERCNRKK